MLKAGASHHIKFVAAATALVLVWFVYTIDLGGKATDHFRKITHPATHGGLGLGHGHGETLPAFNATEFCARYRLKPFPEEAASKRKIYDLLLINTELEMLEIRLGQMAPHVDYFVILESDRTFTDKVKPLYVRENWERFKPYHKQMILRTMDVASLNFDGSTWDREAKSRNAMYSQVVPGLEGEQAPALDDILLVSDMDEIPKPSILRAMRNCEIPVRTTIHSKLYYFSFQWLARIDWAHPQATLYRGLETVLPDDLRANAQDHHFYHAGWHCSYCFSTIEEMQSKLTSFSHSELNTAENKDPDRIVHRIRNGDDLFARPDSILDYVQHNQDIPDFLARNSEKYKFMLDRDPPNANFRDYVVRGGQ